MEQPVISVIIPTYCCAEQLPKRVACLRAQTFGFERLEVLFADDASPDDTGAAAEALAVQYGNVRAVRLPQNSGFGGAPRNAALRMARAPYVMFLDADDALPPDACALLYEAMRQTDADLATGYCRRVLPDGTVVQEIAPAYAAIPPHTARLPQQLREELVMRDSFFCRLYRRALIAAHGLSFPEGTPGEDIFFLYSYLLYCQKTVYLAKHVYDYTLNDASVTHSQTAGYYRRLGRCYEEMRALFARAAQGELFPVVTQGVLEQHLRGMAALEQTDAAALAGALPAWEWLFLQEAQAGRLESQPLAAALLPWVQRHEWDAAAQMLRAAVPLCAALEAAQAEAEEWKRHAHALQRSVEAMRNSRSWRLTHPFAKK